MIKKGLSQKEAERRLSNFGPNLLKGKSKTSPLKLLFNQFTSPLIIVLIISAILSFALSMHSSEPPWDSLLIVVIVILSGVAGFIQDYKAERIIEELSKMASPVVTVYRDGKKIQISSEYLVPGDLVILTSGDLIPADGVIRSGNVQVNESILTGESKGVSKGKDDKIFAGTEILVGECEFEVKFTGDHTRIGQMAAKLREMSEVKTPFQLQMEDFSKKLTYIILFLSIIVFGVGALKFGILRSFLLAVSLAVAAIPEGLPAVLTIALSLGSQRMLSKKALVRKLSVIESIGSVDTICVDKTGTLTKGELSVKGFYTDQFLKPSNLYDRIYQCGLYCNDAYYVRKEGHKKLVGDEIDRALYKFSKPKVKFSAEKLKEVPFTSERKRMSVVYKLNNSSYVFTKGAPEILLELCNRYDYGDKPKRLTPKLKKSILDQINNYSSKGYRLIGMAYKPYRKSEDLEENLIWLGFMIFHDPPRKGVSKAIEDCHEAGIRVIMITGDNPLTAKAIADDIKLPTTGVLTGKDLDNLSDDELDKKIRAGLNVFARVNPFHKLRILESLQRENHVVAMTGDGVNDALALKRADVGIAMGSGTQVAKEASDMVLLDNNFLNIRDAVKEGRTIFNNIRKFTDYLLTCNFAEVLSVLAMTLFLPKMILFPIQILWINLITDGLPAIALGVDPSTNAIMKQPPRPKDEGVLNHRLLLNISGIGFKKAILLLLTYLIGSYLFPQSAITMFFTGYIVYEFVRIGVIRYNEGEPNWLRNKWLNYALLGSIVLHLLLIYGPLNTIFHAVPLGIGEWIFLMVMGIIGYALGVWISKISENISREAYL